MSANGKNKAIFYSGSIDFNNVQYEGFIATQATVVEKIGFGIGAATGSALSPLMTIAAGTEIPVKVNGMKAVGSIIAYKNF